VRVATAAIVLVAVSAAACGKEPALKVSEASYTTLSSSEFESLVDTVSWSGGKTRSRCTNAACTATVQVRIDASPGSHLTDSVNGGPAGRLVARVQNLGAVPTYMYHFKPAPYRYYFWVVRSGSAPRWVLVEHQPGSAPDSVEGGPFYGCGDHPAAVAPDADFKTCDRGIAAAKERSRIASFASRTVTYPPLAQTAEAGAWIGCKYGCCPMATSTE
jgi:hypothetical protein